MKLNRDNICWGALQSIGAYIITKDLSVSIYVIEKRCCTKEAEIFMLCVRDTEIDFGIFLQEVKNLRNFRKLQSDFVETCKDK